MSQVVVIAMTRSGVKILSSKSKDANIECMYPTFVRRLDAECDVDVCRSLLSFGKERKISASLPLHLSQLSTIELCLSHEPHRH